MLLLVLFITIIAFILLWQAKRQQQHLGIPRGKVIYSDTHRWETVEEPLYSPHLRLTGKPDYLFEQGDQIIPVEVKSSRTVQGPYDSHIFQLAVYCLLVKHVYTVRPAYGILHYPNRTYHIDYTQELESATMSLLQELRSQERHKEIPRSHDAPARCNGCGYRFNCDQRLGM